MICEQCDRDTVPICRDCASCASCGCTCKGLDAHVSPIPRVSPTTRTARRMGYHGRPEPTHCPRCGEESCRFDDDCGWFTEFRAAFAYARGSGNPVSVTMRASGGHYYDGFDAGYVVETRDAWDFRSALKAARYLRDLHGRTIRTGGRNYDAHLELSYVSQ